MRGTTAFVAVIFLTSVLGELWLIRYYSIASKCRYVARLRTARYLVSNGVTIFLSLPQEVVMARLIPSFSAILSQMTVVWSTPPTSLTSILSMQMLQASGQKAEQT